MVFNAAERPKASFEVNERAPSPFMSMAEVNILIYIYIYICTFHICYTSRPSFSAHVVPCKILWGAN